VDSKQRQDEFLAKAKEAQAQADQTRDRHEKESWLRIAEGYRDLARCSELKG
jgi:hypothetical protein